MFWPSLESDGHRSLPLVSEPTMGHLPVMVDEVLDLLASLPNKNFLDLTVGGGGHAEAILGSTAPSGMLVGVDRDAEVLARTQERLRPFGERVQLRHGSLIGAGSVVENSGLPCIDGVLIDCGVSSFQIDDPERGFSFQKNGPLDMRMDRTVRRTAKEWLMRARTDELADAIFEYGQERFSRRIARAIVTARKQKRINTTLELAEVIRSAVPAKARTSDIDPATRTFQAIRIVINNEFVELEKGLSDLIERLPSGARLVVIAFHSLEDRIVKNAFRNASKEHLGKVLTPKPLRPTEEEIIRNRRSRSARLRGFEVGGGSS